MRAPSAAGVVCVFTRGRRTWSRCRLRSGEEFGLAVVWGGGCGAEWPPSPIASEQRFRPLVVETSVRASLYTIGKVCKQSDVEVKSFCVFPVSAAFVKLPPHHRRRPWPRKTRRLRMPRAVPPPAVRKDATDARNPECVSCPPRISPSPPSPVRRRCRSAASSLRPRAPSTPHPSPRARRTGGVDRWR